MKKEILIVDDSEIDRQILSNILWQDFHITEADSGYIGLEKMMDHSLHFDAVLLDVSMPILGLASASCGSCRKRALTRFLSS